MPVKVLTNENTYSLQRVTILDYPVSLQMRFSERSKSWYLDILKSDGVSPILVGLKVMPNQNLTGRYRSPQLLNGNFWCLRIANDGSPIGKFNLGVGGSYAIYWLTTEEEEELDLDGQITIR